LSIVALLIVVPAAVAAAFYWSVDIPPPQAMRQNEVTTLYAADGTTLLGRVVPPDSATTYVKLPDVPVQLRDAVLAAEDRDFYRNPGFSVSGFLRAVRDNLSGDPQAGGGSTITQQYVKNAMLGPQRSVLRKMKELLIATKMARQWSKDDILAAYLNTIYFGRGAYGLADASQAYFNKPPSQLTLGEDAVLAAVIRAPSVLGRDDHRPQLTARWNYVLDGMVSMGVLSAADRAGVAFPPIPPAHAAPTANTDAKGPTGLIETQVLQELAALGIADKAVGGLKVTTTIDPKAQDAATGAVDTTMGSQPGDLRAAAVSIDPQSGAVRAYYGGRDGVGYDFAQAPLQTGSAFKVFGLIAGLENGVTLSTQFSSAPLVVHGIRITNVGNETCGVCSISDALKRSLNTSFYRMELSLGSDGPQQIADAAHAAGIPKDIPGVPGTSLTQDGGPPNDGIVLGEYVVRTIDMASAYATVADAGQYHVPYFVQRVVDGDGNVLLDRGAPSEGEQRIPEYITNQVIQAMLPIAAYSYHHQLADGRESAAKTGTTQLGDTGQNKDAWMIGFTPSLSTAVWVGSDHPAAINTQGGGEIYGAGLPADIWKLTMDGALAGTPKQKFDVPQPETGGMFSGGGPSGPLIFPGPSTGAGAPLISPGPPRPETVEPGGPLIAPGPPRPVLPPPPPPPDDQLIMPGPSRPASIPRSPRRGAGNRWHRQPTRPR
jgi:membrane peptidoglycan carboxypeptidase